MIRLQFTLNSHSHNGNKMAANYQTCFIAVLDVTFFTVHGETGTLETFQLLCDFVKRS